MNKTPILDIHHGWIKMIRDYRTGLANVFENDDGSGYTKKTYSGLLYYFTTDPACSKIETAYCFDGVFPLKDPADLFTQDVENVSKLEIEIEYSIDTMWHEPWVYSKCQTFVEDLYAPARTVVEDYGEKY